MQGIKYIGLIVAAMSGMTACSNSNSGNQVQDTTTTATAEADTTAATQLTFKDAKLQGVYDAYIKLKNELVATKFEGAKPAASELANQLKGIAGCENAAVITKKISSATDITVQRAAFNDLNVELIPLFKQDVLSTGTIYLQHCPMANKGDGADWLSSEKKIQNPYYGDEMMECGRVTEEIKST